MSSIWLMLLSLSSVIAQDNDFDCPTYEKLDTENGFPLGTIYILRQYFFDKSHLNKPTNLIKIN